MASQDEIRKIVAANNPAAVPYQPELDKALATLAPYYQSLLDLENGDVEKAKLRLKDDYTRGVRYSAEDLARGNVQRGEDLASFQKYEESQFPREQRLTQEGLNQRGLLNSGIATTDMDRLKLSQEKRREAITRSLQRQAEEANIGNTRTMETAGLTKGRGLEDLATGFTRYSKDLTQTKNKEAAALAAETFGRAIQQKQFEQTQALQPILYGT